MEWMNKKEEHILVCLSESPSNEKVIRTAAQMAEAFHGSLTAIFVETSDYETSTYEEDKRKLRANMCLAEKLGAVIEIVHGDDIPFQIAEFARLSAVTKIIIGKSQTSRGKIFKKMTLTEQMLTNISNLDVYIIPGASSSAESFQRKKKWNKVVFSLTDILKCIGILVAASCFGYIFYELGFAEANIITVYVLAVLLISVVVVNRMYSVMASIVSVLVFNFLFTEPRYTLRAYDQGYPVTFLIMFFAAFLTGTLATKLKNNAKQSAGAAFRTKILSDTNQMFQKAKDKEEIMSVTANQLMKLLRKDIVIYFVKNGELEAPIVFPISEEEETGCYKTKKEQAVAAWVFRNNKHAGKTTGTMSDARCRYLAIRINDTVYGVVGIAMGEQNMDAFENSIVLSILGECALALENQKNAKEKEEAVILAKNEQLRANLLRAISHDLRTPLTSISGNASNLLSNGVSFDEGTKKRIYQDIYDDAMWLINLVENLRTPLTSISGNASNLLSNGVSFDEGTKKRIYQDIYDDAMWLINLVENLLAVTRLEEGRLNLNLAAELVDEVVKEALSHVNRLKSEHMITVENEEEFLLAKMDARLIVQVIINIVDNAIKYTPTGSEIRIVTKKEGKWAVISIADDGPGISDENKKHVFDMFFSGSKKIADSRRSLGLGLALCKSIVNSHGGEISVGDRKPHGTIFTFTLPAEEVQLHE